MCNDCWNEIDLIASKFLVEVDFGYFSVEFEVEFFGQNDWFYVYKRNTRFTFLKILCNLH